MNFFIATVGRSGSTWLSSVLAKGSHTVLHEEAEESPQSHIRAFSPFPIHRFARSNYGEVHGYLRYHLSPHALGAELLVPRRAVLKRDVRKVVTSWMNRDARVPDELGAVIFEVLTQQRILDEWATASGSRVLNLEELSSSLPSLTDLVEWLGVDYAPTEADLAPKNVNDNGHRELWFSWDEKAEQLLRQLAHRQRVSVTVD